MNVVKTVRPIRYKHKIHRQGEPHTAGDGHSCEYREKWAKLTYLNTECYYRLTLERPNPLFLNETRSVLHNICPPFGTFDIIYIYSLQ